MNKQIKAAAISFLLFATGAVAQTTVTGTGTANTIPLFTGSSTLGNSNITQSNGSIGVDTTLPASWSGVSNISGSNLQVFGNATNARLIINSTINDAAELHLVDSAAAQNKHNHRFYADNAGLFLDQPTDTYSSSTVNMFWSNNGSVGIGTSTPGSPLEVNGNITITHGSTGALVFADGTSLSSATGLQSGGGSSTSLGTVTTGVWNATPLTSAYLPSDVDYIDKAQTITGQKAFMGNVGIGMQAPIASLDVSGIIHASGNTKPVVTSQGAYLGWNALTGGAGETDFINNQGGGPGGFAFMNVSMPSTGTPTPSPSTLMFLSGSGSLGIGTTTPGAPLEVNGNIKLTQGSGASMTFPDGTIQATAWNGTLPGGDYAESIDVQGDRTTYEPGDVIVIDPTAPGKFIKSEKAYSKLVAGVFSTKPGLVGRRATTARPDKEAEVPMAMMGIVPTKVSSENGAIEPGDLLVSASTPGYAMKGTDSGRLTGAVIGKALAPLQSGSGVIEVLISLQ